MTTDTVGGVWTFSQELAQGLLEQGCSVALVSLGRMPKAGQVRWAKTMSEHWAERFCFGSTDTPLEWMPKNERSYIEAEPILLRIADDFQPDVIHSNQFCFGALPVAVPKVVTAHSDVLSWAEACLQSPLEDSSWLRQYRSLVQEGLRQADALVAPTAWMLSALRQSFKLPIESIVVPNGRRLDVYPSSRKRIMRAVTVGRLWDVGKGIDTLMNLHAHIPIQVAGEVLDKPSREQGQVDFLGVLDQDAVEELFSTSTVYVCTSYYEPFGLAPLEAALCGCAIVARDIPSLREVWGDAALYFNDEASLAHLLDALTSNEALLYKARAQAHSRARTYTREAMTSTYVATYKRVLHNDEVILNVE